MAIYPQIEPASTVIDFHEEGQRLVLLMVGDDKYTTNFLLNNITKTASLLGNLWQLERILDNWDLVYYRVIRKKGVSDKTAYINWNVQHINNFVDNLNERFGRMCCCLRKSVFDKMEYTLKCVFLVNTFYSIGTVVQMQCDFLRESKSMSTINRLSKSLKIQMLCL